MNAAEPATPSTSLAQARCTDLAVASDTEWLATNGLGGYAAGTVGGINTRRYHGLLVAALAPPGERTLLVAKQTVVAVYDGAATR